VCLDPGLPQFAGEGHSGVARDSFARFSSLLRRRESLCYSDWLCERAASLIRGEAKEGRRGRLSKKLPEQSADWPQHTGCIVSSVLPT